MSQKVVTDAIYTQLVADQSAGTFYAAVSGRIYLGRGSDDAALPLCVYSVISDVQEHYFGNDDDSELSIQFDIYEDVRLGAAVIQGHADKLTTALANKALTPSATYAKIHVRMMDRGTLTIEEDAYRISSDWQVLAS